MFPIPLPQPLLRHAILALHPLQRHRDLIERLLLRQVLVRLLVPRLAVVLDLLARGLHFGHAERGGGAFEEVPEGGEFGEVLCGAVVFGRGGGAVGCGGDVARDGGVR